MRGNVISIDITLDNVSKKMKMKENVVAQITA